ncbi:hypothetical protein BGZ80_003892 [Entomortierella chlamydospora]|uniref:Uncharacterized protein n=1 Tax=Entomortierella chlamydospora TaxID=101097 RepID=A0A9P6MNQ0_9FUNG|nr:hypothetical protein BGZ79_002878 [Entomortierella chlamydospora]KAG0008065.1 hypothetical protein BGZ80_003892 [Entomortierella chlamydospora]
MKFSTVATVLALTAAIALANANRFVDGAIGVEESAKAEEVDIVETKEEEHMKVIGKVTLPITEESEVEAEAKKTKEKEAEEKEAK